MAKNFTWESRRYKRLNISTPVYIINAPQLKLPPSQKIEAVLGNISRDGALIVAPIFLPKGAEIQIELPKFDNLPITFPLRITSKTLHVRVEVIQHSLKHMIGVRFLDLPEQTRKLINEWVEAQLSSQKE